jgi:hypothetical protein
MGACQWAGRRYGSTDTGDSWTRLTGLKNATVTKIAFGDSGLFAMVPKDYAFYRSNDNGESWSQLNADWPGRTIWSMVLKDGFLYAGMTAHGAWKYPLADTASNAIRFPASNPRAREWAPARLRKGEPLRLRLLRRESVRFEAFELDGRKVATLANGILEAGRHDVSTGVSGLRTGQYLLRLRIGGAERMGMLQIED